jgi:hypothetical protein
MSVLLYLTFDLCNLAYFIIQDQSSCPLSPLSLVIETMPLRIKDAASLREHLP